MGFYIVRKECMGDFFGFSIRVIPKLQSTNYGTYWTDDIQIWNKLDEQFENVGLCDDNGHDAHIFFGKYTPIKYDDLVNQGRILFNDDDELCYLNLSDLNIQVLSDSIGQLKVVGDEFLDDGSLRLDGT